MNVFVALLLWRCSHCRQGRIFHSFWHMNEDCPVCGTHFEREQGYWMMSVFIGYVVYGVILAPLALILYFQEVPGRTLFLILGAVIVVLALPVFIYARVIWLYVDEMLDPRKDENNTIPQNALDVSGDSLGSNK